MTKERVEATIKSEKGFYLGDICYVLEDRVYDKIWGEKGDYADGVHTDDKSAQSFAVASTAFGDGCYLGDDGHDYPVDAGVIGLVPLELVFKKNSAHQLGRIVLGAGTAEFTAEGGKFEVAFPNGKTVAIDTCVE